MVHQNIIRNDAGFGNHNFTRLDYVGICPHVFIYGREFTEDLRSIVLVSDWVHFSDYQLEVLDQYGAAFTELHDREHHLRWGGNFLHIGVYCQDNDYDRSCRNTFVVKRHSWSEAQYPALFEDLCAYLDELLVYGT